MTSQNIHILLADDDKVDCMFFQEAIEELPIQANLTVVNDGEQLMELLTNQINEQFDILFLDLNMPRKNGMTCLKEIKSIEKLKSLPVIMFSTSYDESIDDLLYKNAAQHYIRKPADFFALKSLIQMALTLALGKHSALPLKENFLINNI